MRQKLCKQFLFEEVNRPLLTISDSTKIRLNAKTNQLELSIQSYNPSTGDPVYPTDTDLTITTWLSNPTALKQWLGFMMEPLTPNQPANTQVRFKLNDGTDDRYWGGASWDVAGATDWNTENEVSANISSFPATSQQLGVVLNLLTTDGVSTPTVKDLELLYEAEIDYLRSLIVDSLLEDLKASIQPNIDFAIRALGGDKLDLRDLETAYNIVSIEAVYDHDGDPQHNTDLFSSYNATSKTITLTTSVSRGKRMWIVFIAEPEGYLEWGSQDYTEVEKIPAIVIESVDLSGNTVNARFEVKNLNNDTATVRRVPFRLNAEFDIVLIAEKNRTLLAMMDQALTYMATVNKLHWVAVDEYVSMYPIEQGLFRQRATLKDEHTNRFTLRLENIYLWLRPEEVLPLVRRLNITLTDNTLQGGSRWTGIQTGLPSSHQVQK
jgi:hypothetical protein